MTLKECQMNLLLLGASFDALIKSHSMYQLNGHSIYLDRYDLGNSFIKKNHGFDADYSYLSYQQIIVRMKEGL
jgi:hypothetical protein